MTKLEDLTKALLKRRYYDCEPDMYESEEAFYASLDPLIVDEARGEVLALLRELREPDDGMLSAGAHFLTGLSGAACCHRTGGHGGPLAHPLCECREIAPEAYRAMIDHLLSEAGERA